MYIDLKLLKQTIDILKPYLKKGSINEYNKKHVELILNQFLLFFSSPIFELSFPEIKRVSINKKILKGENKRIDYIKHLKYPPAAEVLKYGRANYIGQSILYATFDPITALNEMKPEKGDLITISTWNLLENKNLFICPIFNITSIDNLIHNEMSINFKIGYQNSKKKYSENESKLIDELIHFVSLCFAKDVERGNNCDYFLSAYFSNKIFDLDNKIEAILYPSVPSDLLFSNIAIKPIAFEEKYILKKVKETIVISTPMENGKGYALRKTNSTDSFNFEEDKIIWC